MLTDIKLKSLKPAEKTYKVSDRDGLYVTVSPAGTITFRFDYRVRERRGTLTLGQYDQNRGREFIRPPNELEYGHTLSLGEARLLLARARMQVGQGESPGRAKADGKKQLKAELRFSDFTVMWLRDAPLADSTRAMRKSILDRDILPAFGDRFLNEIKTSDIIGLCDKIMARGAPATAVHVREIVGQIYRHARGRGIKIENPADAIRPSAIATFKPRDRALSPEEIRIFFNTLEHVPSVPTIRLALKQVLLTLCRKGELLLAQWPEVDFEAATWTVPADRMKARRAHVVYLARQSLDIMIAFKTCAGSSPYLLPSRYDLREPMSNATLNRVITAAVAKAKQDGHKIDDFSVHDLRRTGSTLLHEAGFPSDWIEKSLAHEQHGVRAVYNKAEYATQRREMLQSWADMVDGWINGARVVPLHRKAAA